MGRDIASPRSVAFQDAQRYVGRLQSREQVEGCSKDGRLLIVDVGERRLPVGAAQRGHVEASELEEAGSHDAPEHRGRVRRSDGVERVELIVAGPDLGTEYVRAAP